MVARRDDRLEREEVAAVAQERRLERHLQLALASAGLDQRHELREAGPRRLGGDSHPFQLDVVLRPPDADQRVAQLGVRLRRHAKPAHGPAAHERLELVERTRLLGHALAVSLEPRPQQLLGGDRRDELDPALARVEREHAARAFAVGQVQVLRVRAERVRPVAAPGDRDLVAGRDEHDAVVEDPTRPPSPPAPFEELLHRAIVRTSPASSTAPRAEHRSPCR